MYLLLLRLFTTAITGADKLFNADINGADYPIALKGVDGAYPACILIFTSSSSLLLALYYD